MATPYDLYVRYLATRGVDDIVDMNAALAKYKLPAIAQKDLDQAWDLIHGSIDKFTVQQMGSRVYEADFTRALKVLDVLELWSEFADGAGKSLIKLVYDLHQDITFKITLNALLIKRASVTELTRILSNKFSMPLKEPQIDTYMRFFFDPRRMRRSDWKDYLKKCNKQEQKIYFIALTESESVLKTELDLPALVNVSESIQWLLTKSFLKAKTYMEVGTPEANREAREWTDQVVKLADKYEKYRSGDQNDFAKVLQMEFDFIDEPFETPDDATYKEAMSKQRTTD